MNDIERATSTNGFHQRISRHVALGTDRSNEWIDVILLQIGDHVDVIRGSRLAMYGAGKRTTNDVRDTDSG